jgi:hypothetical protein
MKRAILLTLTAVLAASPAQAKSLKWMAGPPGLPSGSKFAVVSGDPSKEGTFTIRAKLPANYTVPPHHHPTDERVSVLSGELAYGMGDKIDRDHAGTLSPHYHVVMQTGMNHWVFTRDAGATVQVTAKGPFQIVYVDPKDDPRTK